MNTFAFLLTFQLQFPGRSNAVGREKNQAYVYRDPLCGGGVPSSHPSVGFLFSFFFDALREPIAPPGGGEVTGWKMRKRVWAERSSAGAETGIWVADNQTNARNFVPIGEGLFFGLFVRRTVITSAT